MASDTGSAFAPKKSLTYLIAFLLLATGAYGFWLWMSGGGQTRQDIPFLICFGVIPLAVFIFMVAREAGEAGQIGASISFQSRLSQMQQRLNAQDDFFQTVANCTPSALTIFNTNNEYWFVNSTAAAELGLSASDVVGKKPVEVVGGERGRKLEKNLDHVKQSNTPVEVLNQENGGKSGVRYLKTIYYPISSFGEFPGGVMARNEDVTTIVIERERRENMLRQIISTLVAVVDRRDPYASGHSARVGQLSRALAVEMNLSDREVEAAEIAGSLMNFGKVLVSRSILTKTEALTQDELQRIRDSIMTSADILSLIDFGSPVVPTLRQVLERFDGTGAPEGLKGDAILITARIVAVANAFVALVSPRAYRDGIDFIVAARNLSRDAGTVFDPRIIEVLESFLRKNASKISWLSVSKPAA